MKKTIATAALAAAALLLAGCGSTGGTPTAGAGATVATTPTMVSPESSVPAEPTSPDMTTSEEIDLRGDDHGGDDLRGVVERGHHPRSRRDRYRRADHSLVRHLLHGHGPGPRPAEPGLGARHLRPRGHLQDAQRGDEQARRRLHRRQRQVARTRRRPPSTAVRSSPPRSSPRSRNSARSSPAGRGIRQGRPVGSRRRCRTCRPLGQDLQSAAEPMQEFANMKVTPRGADGDLPDPVLREDDRVTPVISPAPDRTQQRPGPGPVAQRPRGRAGLSSPDGADCPGFPDCFRLHLRRVRADPTGTSTEISTTSAPASVSSAVVSTTGSSGPPRRPRRRRPSPGLVDRRADHHRLHVPLRTAPIICTGAVGPETQRNRGHRNARRADDELVHLRSAPASRPPRSTAATSAPARSRRSVPPRSPRSTRPRRPIGPWPMRSPASAPRPFRAARTCSRRWWPPCRRWPRAADQASAAVAAAADPPGVEQAVGEGSLAVSTAGEPLTAFGEAMAAPALTVQVVKIPQCTTLFS